METSWKWTAIGIFRFILGLPMDSHAQNDPETFTAKQVVFAEVGGSANANLTPTPKRDSVTAELTDDIVWDSAVVFRIGYRYQKPGVGLFLRAGYTPFFSPRSKPNGGANFQPISAGISVGKSF